MRRFCGKKTEWENLVYSGEFLRILRIYYMRRRVFGQMRNFFPHILRKPMRRISPRFCGENADGSIRTNAELFSAYFPHWSMRRKCGVVSAFSNAENMRRKFPHWPMRKIGGENFCIGQYGEIAEKKSTFYIFLTQITLKF